MLTGMVTFLLLITALLAVPVTLTFQVSLQQEFRRDISLLWLFGLVRLRLSPPKPKSTISNGGKQAQKQGRTGRSFRHKRNIHAVVRQKSFRRRLSKFIRDLWHAVQKKDICMHIRIGLDDPADTGQLWSVVGPVAGIFANTNEASIEIEPDFLSETFTLDGSGNIRLVPLRMIFLFAGILLSPPVWQGIKQMHTGDC